MINFKGCSAANKFKHIDCLDLDYSAHPTDCKMYYKCGLDGLIEYSCPNGLLFDSKEKKCNYPNKVICYQNSSTTAIPCNFLT